MLQFTFCWWEVAAEICRGDGSGADGENVHSGLALENLLSPVCRHGEHGASTPAGTPTRQQGWNMAGQRPGQDYSLRAS